MTTSLKIVKVKEPANQGISGGGKKDGAGRPAIPVPAPILDALKEAKGLGADEALKTTLDTAALAKKFVNLLVKGAKQENLRLFKVILPVDEKVPEGKSIVRFRTEEKTAASELFTS